MFPFFKFPKPCITGDTKGRDNKNLVYLKAVEQQVIYSGQRNDTLAKAAVEEYGGYGMFLDIRRGIFLVIMILILQIFDRVGEIIRRRVNFFTLVRYGYKHGFAGRLVSKAAKSVFKSLFTE